MGDYICMSIFSSLAKCLVMSHLSHNLMYSVPQLGMFKYKKLELTQPHLFPGGGGESLGVAGH